MAAPTAMNVHTQRFVAVRPFVDWEGILRAMIPYVRLIGKTTLRRVTPLEKQRFPAECFGNVTAAPFADRVDSVVEL